MTQEEFTYMAGEIRIKAVSIAAKFGYSSIDDMKTRTNKIVLLCLVALISVTAQAQKKEAKVLATSKGVYLVGAPNAELDEETGMKTVVWHKTEDRNKQTETLWAEDVPTAESDIFS